MEGFCILVVRLDDIHSLVPSRDLRAQHQVGDEIFAATGVQLVAQEQAILKLGLLFYIEVLVFWDLLGALRGYQREITDIADIALLLARLVTTKVAKGERDEVHKRQDHDLRSNVRSESGSTRSIRL